ncbi:hypothetical protein DAPPUDRAFT_109418 [Daphnia pulex]|uniref:Uncharacterized protein n=1 Tax=Daphnia pulex TaxID=6669 RepID=E9H314_DAPPU|nr:hypothetical protein DAPPUDRAFT_109418 [Daphnia pulex]|eukprot:EFX73915.1 hypothetical protein DAPPUDRAFT_109418 [Daphnia pulex]
MPALFAAIVTDQLEMVKCLVNYYQPFLEKDEEQTADEGFIQPAGSNQGQIADVFYLIGSACIMFGNPGAFNYGMFEKAAKTRFPLNGKIVPILINPQSEAQKLLFKILEDQKWIQLSLYEPESVLNFGNLLILLNFACAYLVKLNDLLTNEKTKARRLKEVFNLISLIVKLMEEVGKTRIQRRKLPSVLGTHLVLSTSSIHSKEAFFYELMKKEMSLLTNSSVTTVTRKVYTLHYLERAKAFTKAVKTTVNGIFHVDQDAFPIKRSLIAELKRNITKESARKAAMCLFPKFFTNAEEMSAYIFKKIQSDYSDEDDDGQCDTISSLLTIQQNHIFKKYYSHFIRSWLPNRTTSVLHAKVLDPFNVETIKLILELGADPNALDNNGFIFWPE